MKPNATAFLAAVLVAATVCAFSWVGGFDFNERGMVAFLVAWFAAAGGVVVFLFVRGDIE